MLFSAAEFAADYANDYAKSMSKADLYINSPAALPLSPLHRSQDAAIW